MALISKTTIQEVSDKLDAVSVVGDYVRLEKKSGRWWGRCPFHGAGQEKTPSFKVDPDLKMYHCFGCSKGGSVIGFVMEMEKISYPEAIKNLADKMNISVIYEAGERSENEGSSVKDELFELYKRTTVTFRHFLLEKKEGESALKYLDERGISKDMIDLFNLGYSPSDRNFLFGFLKQKGYSQEFLGKSGLFSANYKSIPLFTGRLMFPITDRQGRIVAFGGRALPAMETPGSSQPKYINSPETDIYRKGQTLYALEQAKPQMRQSKTVYLAEGYMDVIALHQAGVSNAVAPLGTAFTDDQANILRRWVDNVILIFDTDEAGQKAAYKAIITCRKCGISCSVAGLHEGLSKEIGAQEAQNFKDPADILQKFGSEILKNILKFIINDFEYLIERGRRRFIETAGDINKAAEFIFPFLDALDSEVENSDSITRIADIYKIERSAVQKDFLKWKAGGTSRNFNNRQNDTDIDLHVNKKVTRNAELSLLTMVAVNMELYPDFRCALEIKDIDDWAAKELFIAMEECFSRDETGTGSLLERITNESLRKFLVEKGTTGEYKGDLRKFMEDGINKIKKKRLEKRLLDINAQMRESERKNSEELNIEELLMEKISIDSQIRKLEGR